jgi:MvdD pre-ATP grasp domain
MTIEDVDVLLVTTAIDSASDAVARALAAAGVRFYRLDTERLPLEARSSVEFKDKKPQIRWSDRDVVSLDGVRRVWYRRHRLPVLPAETVAAHAEYRLRESQWFVRGLLGCLAERVPIADWMSHPAHVQRAESKIVQLAVASSAGFAIPPTLVSNDPAEIADFFRRQDTKEPPPKNLSAPWRTRGWD